MKGYVESELPKEILNKVYEAIEVAKDTGVVKKGTNETTKAIERGSAVFVIIAGDVDPPEIVLHLPPLCKEKGVPFVFVPEKKQLGKASGIGVGCAAVAIEEAGDAKEILDEIIGKAEKKI